MQRTKLAKQKSGNGQFSVLWDVSSATGKRLSSSPERTSQTERKKQDNNYPIYLEKKEGPGPLAHICPESQYLLNEEGGFGLAYQEWVADVDSWLAIGLWYLALPLFKSSSQVKASGPKKWGGEKSLSSDWHCCISEVL
jgi:hypothetical protein